MAASDARPVPRKNVAYRVTFPILDADGDLVTGATGLDSEVSKDGGTFADCTNEATEIATSSGVYYLDLTSTEMNADTVAVIVKTSSTGAKTTVLVMYPEEAGDMRADVVQWSGTTVATPDTAGYPKVTLKTGTGTGEISLTSGAVTAGSLGTTAKADVNAEVVDALVTDTYAEVSGVVAATSSLKDKINWVFALARNKVTQTATTQTLRNDADNADLATAAVSDNGTTFTRGEWA